MKDATETGFWFGIAWEVNPHLRPPQDDEADALWDHALDIYCELDGEANIFEIYDDLRVARQEASNE